MKLLRYEDPSLQDLKDKEHLNLTYDRVVM